MSLCTSTKRQERKITLQILYIPMALKISLGKTQNYLIKKKSPSIRYCKTENKKSGLKSNRKNYSKKKALI